MKRFLGHYCEIVYKQIIKKPDKKSAINGMILDINNAGFILIKNQDGIHCLNPRKIITIKFQEKTLEGKL